MTGRRTSEIVSQVLGSVPVPTRAN
jgi:hypothetical protein